MTNADVKLSVPPLRKRLPRALSIEEVEAATRIGDVLIHGDSQLGPPGSFGEFPQHLDVALAARVDSFDLFVQHVAKAPAHHLAAWVRQCHDDSPETFQILSTVLAGAYLLIPAVRTGIGYPGQHKDPAGLEEAVDQLSDGIMDPVIERGHFYVPAPPKE